MKTVCFVTSAFPYYPGEQFIEEEIKFWACQDKVKVVLLPLHAKGAPRNVPQSVEVSLALSEKTTQIDAVKAILAAALAPFYWAELIDLLKRRRFSFSTFFSLSKEAVVVKKIQKKLNRAFKDAAVPPDVYTYWNGAQTYAAVLLKKEGAVARVFSRVHRYDLYEYGSPLNYLPLKRQFLSSIDRIFSISDEGVRYMTGTYGVRLDNLSVSRLGVSFTDQMAQVSAPGCLHLLSVSYCAPVKRLDKLVGALEVLSSRRSDLKIKWVHIGDGPDFNRLVELAQESLADSSVEWYFAGEKPNDQVRAFFESNAVDLFVNVSDSEGVPVTIMEAMSYGVPAIAPKIGGIPELVSSDCGFLLDPNPSILDVATAIDGMSEMAKGEGIRFKAKARIFESYRSKENYSKLVNSIVD